MGRLSCHPQFTTDDMSKACQHMGRLLHRNIELIEHERGRFSMASATLRFLSIHAFEVTGRIRIRSQSHGDSYTLFRMEGDGTAERMEHGQPPLVIGPGQGVLTTPDSLSTTQWTGGSIAICMPTKSVQAAVRQLIGQFIEQPIKTLGIPNLASCSLGERLDALLEQLEMPDGGIFGRYPKYGREIQNELIENVVRMLPHSLQPLLSKYSGGAARRHADELEEFVSQHFSDPRLSAKVMAKGIGVSDRTLRESCHRIYQQGPDEVLRRMRLDIAHRRLENPLPGDTDTRVAHETGFRDFRRFVKHYKEAYHGESPRETLQRGLAKAKGGAT